VHKNSKKCESIDDPSIRFPATGNSETQENGEEKDGKWVTENGAKIIVPELTGWVRKKREKNISKPPTGKTSCGERELEPRGRTLVRPD